MQQSFGVQWHEADLSQEIDTLQLLAGGPYGYRLRRIILTNFWLYTSQEFEIPHGRLFLAGENASGKSTVLTAALPLALEGNLRANRLDTFGGLNRHAEYYVLGSEESATPFKYEKRTAYIALEFEWSDPDTPPFAPELRQRWYNGERNQTRFLTVGLSLYGNETASNRISPLYFLVTDGARLGHDIPLTYRASDGQERAYSQRDFKQSLKDHGIICDTQREYERYVSHYLFDFDDPGKFHSLIELLLMLRRPNLSSELTLSRVYDYLNNSLPSIPIDKTKRVIETINEIENIRRRREQLSKEYQAAAELHDAQQRLVLTEAQNAACDYIDVYLTLKKIQAEVAKLHKDADDAEKNKQQAETVYASCHEQRQHVLGQITALEASEGVKLAGQVAAARERVRIAEERTAQQQKNLDRLHKAIPLYEEKLHRQHTSFKDERDGCESQLANLHLAVAEQALWHMVAVQFEQSLERVSKLQLDNPSTVEAISAAISLIHIEPHERLQWLHELETLHQQRKEVDAELQHALAEEKIRRTDLDTLLTRLQTEQAHFDEALLKIDEILQQLLTTYAAFLTTQHVPHTLDTTTAAAADIFDDSEYMNNIFEQCTALYSEYQQTLQAFDRDLSLVANHLQVQRDKLQEQASQKRYELSELTSLYEQKEAEPEAMPVRTPHRALARSRLAEHGIVARPLYTLIDFAPGIDSQSQEAGRLEYILEDAGILDALVVPPSHVAAAEVILQAEGLSDCRLNIEDMAYEGSKHEAINQHKLCFDEAGRTTLNNPTAWETIITPILANIESLITSTATSSPTSAMPAEDTWHHGLLTGRAGAGRASYIGLATRLRVRQQELDELNEKRNKLNEELALLTTQIADCEAQRAALQSQQEQLRRILPQSGLDSIYIELKSISSSLGNARKNYRTARELAQQKRQRRNWLTGQLEQKSGEVPFFARDYERLRVAIQATSTLDSHIILLQNRLQGLINIYRDYQETKNTLYATKNDEISTSLLYRDTRDQFLRDQAALAELLQMLQLTDKEEPGQRLASLRSQEKALQDQITQAAKEQATAEEKLRQVSQSLTEAEERLQGVQEHVASKQSHFTSLLSVYPVAKLQAAQAHVESENYFKAAQTLQDEQLNRGNIATYKDRLESEQHKAQRHLSQAYYKSMSVLQDYGPELADVEGRIYFTREDKCNPSQLLEIIDMQRQRQADLLRAEESKLFENFLLQEMAETIRSHILAAEVWAATINKSLSTMSIVGEQYSLVWLPNTKYDETQLGGHLSRYHRLLRKAPQTLTDEERETLRNAFQQEIETMRLKQASTSGMNFEQILQEIFDYRKWFHFEVDITQKGGQKQRLTNKLLGGRSGAEQLFALYVPLFAALAALYESAARGAPRLLALDEAFDKASASNMQRIIEFLAKQNFQWIMTGPQLNISGSQVPVSIRYLMLHEKGSQAATATFTIWQSKPTVDT